MRRTTIAVLSVASLALAGCVAVPVHEPVYYGPPPAVVVQPSVGFGYSGHYPRPHRHHRHHWHGHRYP